MDLSTPQSPGGHPPPYISRTKHPDCFPRPNLVPSTPSASRGPTSGTRDAHTSPEQSTPSASRASFGVPRPNLLPRDPPPGPEAPSLLLHPSRNLYVSPCTVGLLFRSQGKLRSSRGSCGSLEPPGCLAVEAPRGGNEDLGPQTLATCTAIRREVLQGLMLLLRALASSRLTACARRPRRRLQGPKAP